MKVAVSIPDPVFSEAELLAWRLGTTRSDVYARALIAFIGAQAPDCVNQAMNDVVDAIGPAPDAFVRAATRRVLDQVEW